MNTTAPLSNAEGLLNIEDIQKGPLAASPLLRPLIRLAEGLNALVRDNHLQGVSLELKHLDNPYFLLRVAPDKPPFYVELFLGDLDGGLDADEAVPLCVLMNWLGSDTEPVYWETEWEALACEPGSASQEPVSVEEPDFQEPDFGEVLSHVLFMTDL